ncbi:hypothetical protein RHMOL_Rhmol10G0065000 [Rhododendron molle]|uniref:Uncharacterized protein n=1 Tax=Rhododendron molle TaxID=49168 RepID=A0ACC0M1A4_RHOML|nr:hypothetical protein RHMOL_Rhmol10G0065000 [Rhododendron molle]
MDSCRRIYKDNKAKIKADHYTSYMFPDADPNIALRVPDFVDPDQWKELVEYWQIEEVVLATNGESLDKMSVYLQTRKQDNPEVKEMMIIMAIVGTYGGGVRRSSVYKKDSGPSQTINPSSMAEIEQRIEARLTERFTSQFEKLQYHMFEYMESRGSEAIQFPDTTSGHRAVRDQSIGGDTSTLERGHRTPTRSPGPIEQVIEKEMDDY